MDNLGKRNLVDYGIQNEQSDLRAHVCPIAHCVYVFPTTSGLKAIESNRYRKVPGYQNGIDGPTSEGYLVPPMEIEKCIALRFRQAVWEHLDFSAHDTLTEKGRKAVMLIQGMIKSGLFPLAGFGQEIDERAIQISGMDIIVTLPSRTLCVQVKCDFPGGESELGGSGNLFLQVAERNPLKLR